MVGRGKKSVKYCNLFINILFTRPRFEAINNDDTCELELTGSCGVCHIRISRWCMAAVYPSSSARGVPPIPHAAPPPPPRFSSFCCRSKFRFLPGGKSGRAPTPPSPRWFELMVKPASMRASGSGGFTLPAAAVISPLADPPASSAAMAMKTWWEEACISCLLPSASASPLAISRGRKARLQLPPRKSATDIFWKRSYSRYHAVLTSPILRQQTRYVNVTQSRKACFPSSTAFLEPGMQLLAFFFKPVSINVALRYLVLNGYFILVDKQKHQNNAHQ